MDGKKLGRYVDEISNLLAKSLVKYQGSFCMFFGEVINRYAFVAQSVERLICNQNVVGSSPIGSFKNRGSKE